MATSSAEPEKLYRYSDVALSLDSEVKSESARFRGSLVHFESACREPGFRLSVVHHAGSMSSYGSQCETVDVWVRRVGVGFQAADSGGFGFREGGGLTWSLVPWRLPKIELSQPPSIPIKNGPTWLDDITERLPWNRESVESPEPIKISLPSLDTVFDVFKASLSTLLLFVSSTGLQAAKLTMSTTDFFFRKLPKAEDAFSQWEEYNRQPNWNRETARQYEEEAKKALEELGVTGLKDALDSVADTAAQHGALDEHLAKLYDAIGAVDDWIQALGGDQTSNTH